MPYLFSQQTREAGRPFCGAGNSSEKELPEVSLSEDRLTGLADLQEFYRIGGPIVEHCLANGDACAVAILDIDHFRRLTSTYCEDTGLMAIKQIADRFRVATTGSRHVVARLGEQVFGMLLVGLDAAQSTQFCELLRADVAVMPICTANSETFITVSVGLAEIYGPETFDNYLNAAEQFLFMSKSYGRNRVFSDHTIALQLAA